MRTVPAATCTRAWLDAATHLQSQTNARDYNVILEINEPMVLHDDEKAVYAAVDSFLTKHQKQSINTVVNTIFPAGFYARGGADKVIDDYGEIAGKIRHHPDNRRWGTYAYRMLTKRTDARNREFVPLQVIIEKLQKQLKKTSTLRAAYEISLIDPIVDIPIYEAESDRDNTIGGPCLSHISFKLKDNHRLMLTAFYRSHYYIQRALGNLFGLAWLQDFVSTRVGVQSAELVCISSMAVLETEPNNWGKTETDALLKQCRAALDEVVPAP
jgi:thymidylate synthase